MDSLPKHLDREAGNSARLFAVLGLMIPPLSVVALIRSRSWNWIRIVSIVGVLFLIIESVVFLRSLEVALAITSH